VKIETVLQELDFPPQSRWRVAVAILGWALVAVYFAFCAAVLALRYWILPNVGAHSAEIEQSVSKALGLRVTISSIEAGWQGLRPELFLGNVTVHDADGRPALSLPVVEATFSWQSVLVGSPRFHSLAFERPRLEVRRDSAGRFHVAGIELHAQLGSEAGVAQWVLSQRQVIVRDAAITWVDEQRGAPPLSLSEVNFQLRDGSARRFALRATPPAELASKLDIRGELRGGDLLALQSWTGQLYAELEYTDLTAWRPWLDTPLAIQSGKGGVRVWFSVGENHVSEVTADVALAQVVTRVAKGLPLLDLEYLQGRLGARQSSERDFEFFGRKLTLKTRSGVALAPADFRVRWRQAGEGAPQKVEAEADQLELGPLADLAEYLPFPQAARAQLAAIAPRGGVQNLKMAWAGDTENPSEYNLRGGFSNLAARANAGHPGFAGLSGRVEASEKGGTLTLASRQVTLELPGIIAESTVQLESLTTQLSWTLEPGQFEVAFNNLSIVNRDFSGTLFGTFSSRESGPGVIDLTGHFSRADGRSVYRYVPYLPAPVVEYLKASTRAGQSNDVRLRLKGDLARFPFADPSIGIFQVVARVENAEFRFAEGWPAATGVTGELIFDGRSMRIAASRAAIFDVRSNNVRVRVPDLYSGDERVEVDVQAEGETSAFLRFIAQSPVTKYLDGFTEGFQASGAGRLSLLLDLPLRHTDQAKVTGDYQFLANQIRLDAEAPPFAQVNGRIEFTGSGVSARALTAQFLGGPATLSVSTRADGTIVANAHGTASVSQFPRSWDSALLRRASGAAAWQATVSGTPGGPVTASLQSQLTGISIALPAPFGKTAVEPMLLKVERVTAVSTRRGDTINASLGSSVNLQIERRREGERYVLDRGILGLNEPAVLSDRSGLAVTGRLDYVDVDRWRELFGDGDDHLSSSSLDLKVAALDFGGRRLNDVTLRAGTSGSVWIANVSSKELAGEIAWRPEGQGRIVARLKHFTLPEPAPGGKVEAPSRNLPALDIIADNLVVADKNLGRLELIAVNEALDWRIEKLVLTGPESLLTANGTWQAWAQRPGVNVSFGLEIRDAGKYLDRIGYPRTLQRGQATLKGSLNWAGSPQSIDFPSLKGSLELKAENGQFLKAEPGAARLLGILSLQSLATLDFRDLFGRGFAFDSIRGKAGITDGIMTMSEFEMRGASARVTMDGSIDFVKETQDLRARVEPSVGNSISSIVLVVVNPVWGLGALILDKILKNPLGQAFAFEYKITGTWTEPQVKPLKADVRTADTPQQSPP
jgi:uncharacterized protein (TIGR02099 family)